jgi:hypothetical protein
MKLDASTDGQEENYSLVLTRLVHDSNIHECADLYGVALLEMRHPARDELEKALHFDNGLFSTAPMPHRQPPLLCCVFDILTMPGIGPHLIRFLIGL